MEVGPELAFEKGWDSNWQVVIEGECIPGIIAQEEPVTGENIYFILYNSFDILVLIHVNNFEQVT